MCDCTKPPRPARPWPRCAINRGRSPADLARDGITPPGGWPAPQTEEQRIMAAFDNMLDNLIFISPSSLFTVSFAGVPIIGRYHLGCDCS